MTSVFEWLPRERENGIKSLKMVKFSFNTIKLKMPAKNKMAVV